MKWKFLQSSTREALYFNELESLEQQVLELTVRNQKSVAEIVNIYLSGIERMHPDLLCSVDERQHNRLVNLAAPSLPAQIGAIHETIMLTEATGPFDSPNFRTEKIVIDDLATDIRLKNLTDLPEGYELKGCSLRPILNCDNETIAILATYYQGNRLLTEHEENTIERARCLLRMLLENHHRYRALRISNERFEYAAEATFDVIWDWNLETNGVYYSGNMLKLFGHRAGTSYDNLPFYFENVHPDDRERVVLYPDEVKNGSFIHWTQEYRFRKANGEYAWVLDKGIVIRDENGIGNRMIGAMQDITTLKKQNERLTEIALINAHEIRRPLANIIALTQLLKDSTGNDYNIELTDHLNSAAEQLDDVIKKIIQKTTD